MCFMLYINCSEFRSQNSEEPIAEVPEIVTPAKAGVTIYSDFRILAPDSFILTIKTVVF